MARRRRHSKRFHKKEGIFSRMIGPVTFASVFLSQVSIKDRTATFNTLQPDMKLKVLLNAALGRVTGVTIFPEAPNATTSVQTFNPAGAFNNFTFAGIGGVLANKFLPLPHKGTTNKIFKNMALGGIIGGIFDDPAQTQMSQQLSIPPSYYSNSPGTQGGLSSGGVFG